MSEKEGKGWLLAFIDKDIDAIEDIKKLVELRATIRTNMKMFGVKEKFISDRNDAKSMYEFRVNSSITAINDDIRDLIRHLPVPVAGSTLDAQIESLFERSKILTDMRQKVQKVRL